jgi:competence protein ComEC
MKRIGRIVAETSRRTSAISALMAGVIASVVAFAFGIFWLQRQAELPAGSLLLALAIGGLAAIVGALWRPLRFMAPVGAFVIGFAWAGGLAQQRFDVALALDNEVRDLQEVGVIAELPQRFDNGLRFDFAVEQAPAGVPQHISAWYRSFRVDEENLDAERQQVPDLRAGERWRLTLRLK